MSNKLLIDKLYNGNIIGNLNGQIEEISACQFNSSGNNVLTAFINFLNLKDLKCFLLLFLLFKI